MLFGLGFWIFWLWNVEDIIMAGRHSRAPKPMDPNFIERAKTFPVAPKRSPTSYRSRGRGCLENENE